MTKADLAAVILWTGATLYAVFGGADFGGGLWDLVAGDAEKGERPRARIQRSLTPVWEANHVWLIFILVVLWTAFPEAFGGDHVDPLRAAGAGGGRDRPSRRRVRLPQVDPPARAAAGDGRDLRDLLGPDPLLHGHGGRRDRRRQRARRRQRRRLLELDRAAAAADRGPLRRHRRLPRGDLPRRRLARRRRRRDGGLLLAPRARRRPRRRRPRRRRARPPALRSPLRLRPPGRRGAAAGDPLGALRAPGRGVARDRPPSAACARSRSGRSSR